MAGWRGGGSAQSYGASGWRWMREEGYVVEHEGGARVSLGDAGELPPALQGAVRARWALGDVLVVCEGAGQKRNETHVDVRVAAANITELAEIQEKFDITAFYATDGTRQLVPREDGSTELVAARAARRHDGSIIGGRVCEKEGEDNYLAELVAVIDACAAEADGARILLAIDATSPVRAVLSFRRASARGKQGKKAAELLGELERQLKRAELVVFLWTTSHEGCPVNEAADVAADHEATNGMPTPVGRAPCDFASLRYPAHGSSARDWATPRALTVAYGRLLATVGQTELRNAGDLPLPPLATRGGNSSPMRSARLGCSQGTASTRWRSGGGRGCGRRAAPGAVWERTGDRRRPRGGTRSSSAEGWQRRRPEWSGWRRSRRCR